MFNKYIATENQDAVILHLLPYLITGRRITQKRKKNQETNTNNTKSNESYSLLERREGVLIHLQVIVLSYD